MGNFSVRNRVVNALPPAANVFASTVYSDIISMKGAEKIIFILQRGVGASGTATITVEACDNVSPSNTAAVPFRHKQITGGDVEGALTDAAAAGYTTTAGSNAIDIIEVDAERLAAEGYGFCRVKSVEVNASAVLAGILAIVETHFAKDVKDSPLA
jgi:hypothetical protein